MDEMRAQLSLLMDTINEENRPREKQFTDSSFCRMYLAGICPHDLFANTKHYLGACPKEHSDEMRMRFLEARKKKRYGFEEETLHVIQPLVDDSDRKIFRGQARCEDVDKKGVVDERSDEVRKLDQQIEAIMKQAEELGNEGKIDESMKMMVKVEQLNEEKAKHLEEEKNGDFAFNQKLKPCDVCGALLAATDSDRRLSEHFSGKIHIGFQMLRDAVKDLNAYLQTPLPDESHSKSKDGERDSGRSDRGDRRVDPANTASRSDEKYASSYHGRKERRSDRYYHSNNADLDSRGNRYDEPHRNSDSRNYHHRTARESDSSYSRRHRRDNKEISRRERSREHGEEGDEEDNYRRDVSRSRERHRNEKRKYHQSYRENEEENGERQKNNSSANSHHHSLRNSKQSKDCEKHNSRHSSKYRSPSCSSIPDEEC